MGAREQSPGNKPGSPERALESGGTPMESYLLPPHVHCCDVDDGAVFLDLDREKYFALGRDEILALRRVVDGWSSGFGSEFQTSEATDLGTSIAEQLVASGLLTKDRSLGKVAPTIRLDRLDAIDFTGRDASDPPIAFQDVLDVGRAYLSAVLKLRFLGFRDVVRNVTALKSSSKKRFPMGPDTVRRFVSVFRRVRCLYYTAEQRCLLDSLVIIHFLLRHGVTPIWVMGVTTRPFGAHSWVQFEGTVLTDPLELSRRFTPILVI